MRAAGEGIDDLEAQEFAKAKEADVLAALAEVQADLSAAGRAFQF